MFLPRLFNYSKVFTLRSNFQNCPKVEGFWEGHKVFYYRISLNSIQGIFWTSLDGETIWGKQNCMYWFLPNFRKKGGNYSRGGLYHSREDINTVCFDIYSVTSKSEVGDFFSNFVSFSEYINFTNKQNRSTLE